MHKKESNQRDLLNTLTDAGLIPIYAFPEAGIELKSVLWRRKASDAHTPGAYVALLGDRVRHPAAMREASKAALRSFATFGLGAQPWTQNRTQPRWAEALRNGRRTGHAWHDLRLRGRRW